MSYLLARNNPLVLGLVPGGRGPLRSAVVGGEVAAGGVQLVHVEQLARQLVGDEEHGSDNERNAHWRLGWWIWRRRWEHRVWTSQGMAINRINDVWLRK